LHWSNKKYYKGCSYQVLASKLSKLGKKIALLIPLDFEESLKENRDGVMIGFLKSGKRMWSAHHTLTRGIKLVQFKMFKNM